MTTIYYAFHIYCYLHASLDMVQIRPKINPDFLPFYAILRAIPSKIGGVLAMGGA